MRFWLVFTVMVFLGCDKDRGPRMSVARQDGASERELYELSLKRYGGLADFDPFLWSPRAVVNGSDIDAVPEGYFQTVDVHTFQELKVALARVEPVHIRLMNDIKVNEPLEIKSDVLIRPRNTPVGDDVDLSKLPRLEFDQNANFFVTGDSVAKFQAHCQRTDRFEQNEADERVVVTESPLYPISLRLEVGLIRLKLISSSPLHLVFSRAFASGPFNLDLHPSSTVVFSNVENDSFASGCPSEGCFGLSVNSPQPIRYLLSRRTELVSRFVERAGSAYLSDSYIESSEYPSVFPCMPWSKIESWFQRSRFPRTRTSKEEVKQFASYISKACSSANWVFLAREFRRCGGGK